MHRLKRGCEAEAPLAVDQRVPLWLLRTIIVTMYLAAVLLYILLGRAQPVPQVTPDEFTYGTLARSLANGDGLTMRGGSLGLRAALYVYAIAPAWRATTSIPDAYAIAKIIGAAICCLVIVPTWFLARRYMTPLLAVIPATLAVAGSWMTQTGQLMTENLALPLAVGALTALTLTLRQPRSRLGLVAVALALLASWARAQLVILVPIIFVALLVDVAAQTPHWRQRLRENAKLTLLTGVLTLAGAVAFATKPSILGSYSQLQEKADLAHGLSLSGQQALAFVVMAGVLPLTLALATSARRTSWAENQLRAPLIVFWVSTVAFVLQTGILTTAFDGADWSIQRYVEYTVPLLYVLGVAAAVRQLLEIRFVAGATVLVSGALLLTPAVQNPQEQRGILSLVSVGKDTLGVSGGATLALVALVGGTLVCVALAVARRGGPGVAVLLCVVLGTLVVLGVQDQRGWSWQRDQARAWRAGYPQDLQWIDHSAHAPVARLVGNSNPFRAATTEFFNRDVARIYRPADGYVGPALLGPMCDWGVDQNGVAVFSTSCGAPPTRFLLDDDLAKLTFAGQRVLDEHPGVGRVISLDLASPAKPRLEAWVTPACSAVIRTQNLRSGRSRAPETGCSTQSSGRLWLDRPGRLEMTFRGAHDALPVQVLTTKSPTPWAFQLPPRSVKRLSVPVPAGASEFEVDFGFAKPRAQREQLQTSIELIQGQGRRQLLY